MERIKRNGRISAMARILTASPNRIFSLSHFCAMFDAAKSTISEDIELLRGVFSQFSLGEIETVTGSAGGVRFLPRIAAREALEAVRGACETLAEPSRVLPGGFLYIADILGNPPLLDLFGLILAQRFAYVDADFVLTVESKGIAFAAAVARAMGLPLVIARTGPMAHEGPNVAIHYLSGSDGAMQIMSLARRAVKEGQSALIVDDFMRAGGTARGMEGLMSAFSVRVAGTGVMIRRADEGGSDDTVSPLMLLHSVDKERGAFVSPAPWLEEWGSVGNRPR